MNEFLEWLKENKISINGKYKGKRWGSVNKSEDGGEAIEPCAVCKVCDPKCKAMKW